MIRRRVASWRHTVQLAHPKPRTRRRSRGSSTGRSSSGAYMTELFGVRCFPSGMVRVSCWWSGLSRFSDVVSLANVDFPVGLRRLRLVRLGWCCRLRRRCRGCWWRCGLSRGVFCFSMWRIRLPPVLLSLLFRVSGGWGCRLGGCDASLFSPGLAVEGLPPSSSGLLSPAAG